MFKQYFIFLFSIFLLIACEDPFSPFESPVVRQGSMPCIQSFSIGTDTFSVTSTSMNIYIDHPGSMKAYPLVASFSASGIVKVNGVVQKSGISVNDFSKPVVYTVYSESGEKKVDYTINTITFTRLPKLYITTQGGSLIDSKENYVNATFRMEPNGQYNCDVFEGEGRIKGRGNSTWGMPKKPYKIKLDQAAGLLGLEPAKEWVLLANYIDKTLIRNYLAYKLSDLLDMPFSPAHEFVEVFLNGEHVGNYMLSDQIEIGESRVNISKTDGYLLEIDYRSRSESEENVGWFESSDITVALKDPDELAPVRFNAIKNHVMTADKALTDYAAGNKNIDYRRYFDVESTIRWFLVNEFFKNGDAAGYSSIFFYKNKDDDKLYMGPVWDFDIAAGNAAHQPYCLDPTDWWVINMPRISRMYYADPTFEKRVKEIWRQYKPQFMSIIQEVDVMAEKLDLSQKANYKLWPDFNDPSYFVIQGNKTYQGQVAYLKNFLQKRYNWMDAQFNRLSIPITTSNYPDFTLFRQTP